MSTADESTAWDESDSPGAPETWPYAGAWRVGVERRRATLAGDLARLGGLTPSQVRERAHLRALLKDAGSASQARVGIAKWWWGTEIERAWARLHEVEERAVDLVPAGDLPHAAVDALAHAGRHLESDDKRVVALEAVQRDVTAGTKQPAALRPAIREVLRASHAKSDRDNVEARYLRNRLLLASAAAVVLTAIVLIAQRSLTGFAFLDPATTLGNRPTTYLFLVMLFGAVGALFTALPAFTRIASDFSPFNLPLQQAVLKLAFGPLAALVGFAIVGMIESTDAVNPDVLPITSPTTLPAALMLAVIFGAAQQIVTRFVDRRADEILTAIAPEDDK